MRGTRLPHTRNPPIQEVSQPTTKIRFAEFEANLATGELRKHGVKLKLHEQPFRVLAMLLARPGELITREEIRAELWPEGTFVDFENGLNNAVNRLRSGLSDSADEPKFIETVPRRGYRFIALVERLNGNSLPVLKGTAEQTAHRSKAWSWPAIASVAVVLFVAVFAGWRLFHRPKNLLNFGPRDWVLISSFENRTGNPVLDGTLEYALEGELSNSQFVTVVPRERANDVLLLMRKPLNTKIDAALGREICQRDGGIRVLLTGRVEKIGTVYVLTVQLVDPANGVTVASISEEDQADSQMAAAVRRLSDHVREVLGEKRALIQQSDRRMEQVTTPSLHALQLYTQANDLMRLEGDQITAQELLKRSVAEDPSFASAHLLLAWTYWNTGQVQKARPESRRALDLADTTSDRERFFIRGSYYSNVEKDMPRAIQSYETLLRLYPDHYWGSNNLLDLYLDNGRIDEAAGLCLRLADSRPNDMELDERAIWAKLIVEQDWNGAQPYIQRASAIIATQGQSLNPSHAAWVELFPAYAKWLQGDVVEAHTGKLQHERNSIIKDPAIDGLLSTIFGELQKAERQMQTAADPQGRDLLLARVAYVRNDWAEVRRLILEAGQVVDIRNETTLILMARAGLVTELKKILHGTNPDDHPIVAGELCLAQGDTVKAVRFLEDGVKVRQSWGIAVWLLGSESLARIYTKQHKLEEALRILQSASDSKHWSDNWYVATGGSFAWNWAGIRLQLADLYREMGRTSEAEQVEAELSKLLIYADPDHPVLRELQKRKLVVASVTHPWSTTSTNWVN